MRAAIYARYSSDQQRDASIEDQVRVCKELVQRQGWTVVQVYQDRASSGATMLRAGYQALLQDARAAEFDVIVAEALDRLSRDQEDIAALYKRVSHAGVAIHTHAEGVINELHIGLKGTMNALFLKDLAAKTRRGLRGRIEAGKSGGGVTYGYEVVSRLDINGDLLRGERAINPAEAETVRSIFRDYAAGKSPKGIALALNDRKVPGPRGGAWAATTINGNRDRGTGILNNELYVGSLVWNRLSYSKEPETGKRRSRANASDQIVRTDVPDLRIVDDALWQAARKRQERLDAKAAKLGGASPHGMRHKQAARTLFSGLMRCGVCHGGFSKISEFHYGCSQARNKGPMACSNLRTIRRDRLEAEVLDGLRSRLMDADLYEVFAREFTAEWNRLQAEGIGERARWEAERKRVRMQIERLVDAIADGQPVASLKGRLLDLEGNVVDLDAKLAAAPVIAPRLHPELPRVYREKVLGLAEALANDSGLAAMAAIRDLVDEIRLIPVGDDPKLRIEVRGELSAILNLAGGSRGAADQFRIVALTGGGRRGQADYEVLAVQMKMVAGTGFEPVTFRL